MPKLKVFIGYDPKEDIAWDVASFSLKRHSSIELEIIKLNQRSLRDLGLYSRPSDPGASTEFSLTRFLTPYLAATDYWSIFVDCDFLFTVDIANIFSELDDSKAIHVVKHDYVPRQNIKMDGTQQTTYPRKNWSSFMVFNGSHPKVKNLTPNIVNEKSPAFLHRFEWLEDSDIGGLQVGWNFLEGEYQTPTKLPYAIHYTNGGPWFENWKDVDYADLWNTEKRLLEESRLD